MKLILLALSAGIVLTGCSGSTVARVPVFGRASLDNQPLAEAMVVFHPQGTAHEGAPKPQAITDASGQFQLTTLRANDGAPAGDYLVTVELREPQLLGEETVRSGRNLLPPQYAQPGTTPLRCTVQPGIKEVSLNLSR